MLFCHNPVGHAPLLGGVCSGPLPGRTELRMTGSGPLQAGSTPLGATNHS